MKLNTKPNTTNHAVLNLEAEQESALTFRRLAYAVHLSEEQRVLSNPSRVREPQNTQRARKAAGSSMNSESVQTDPFTVAQSALATWSRIDDALSPIIGQCGVAGLFKRSLSLTRGAHPALTAVFEGQLAPGDYSTLEQALAQLSAPIASAANAALLQTFSDLLTKLIGLSLTERLLRPLLDNPSTSGAAVKDTSS